MMLSDVAFFPLGLERFVRGRVASSVCLFQLTEITRVDVDDA